jgi:hypothetical protein
MSDNVVQFPRKTIPRCEDDYHQRMRANLAALAFIAILLLGSCLVIDTLISIRADCNFSVR